jgi:plasmid stabilization system protein ParE
MAHLTYRPRFTADLDDIYDYYAQYSEERATDLIVRIEEAVFLVADNPEMGTRAEEIAPNLRRFVIDKHYLFFYLFGFVYTNGWNSR